MKSSAWTRSAKAVLAAFLAFGSVFGLSRETAYAEEGNALPPNAAASPVAFTAAPPPELFSVFDPSHLYLDNGTSSISATSGTVKVTATTSANRVVDSIGVTFYVQKWNGSAWENVGSGSTLGDNSRQYYSNTFSKSVTAGYYYRGRTIHWVIHNGVYEEGEVITTSILGV